MHASYSHEHNSSYVRFYKPLFFDFFFFFFFFLLYSNTRLTWSSFSVLNKCDLLQAKLQRGVRIRDSVPSFGDRKNDLQTATRCTLCYIHSLFLSYLFLKTHIPDFQQHFKEISKNHSPVARPFYVHLTSVIVRFSFFSFLLSFFFFIY